MSATRYGMMMMRYAATKPLSAGLRERVRTGPGGWMAG